MVEGLELKVVSVYDEYYCMVNLFNVFWKLMDECGIVEMEWLLFILIFDNMEFYRDFFW